MTHQPKGLVTLLGCVIALQGCGGTDSDSGSSGPLVAEEDRYGGTVVVSGGAEIETINSLVTTDYTSDQHQAFVLFAPLARLDEQFKARPYLARSWEINADTSQVILHLREDATWHDGVPVTADDVILTFNLAKNPGTGFPNASYFDYWDAAEAVDARTVRFTIRSHTEPFFGWARTALVPAHIIGDTPPEELANHPFGSVSPVGNGPFRFVERTADSWVFEANEDFPEDLGGRPYLDRLVYRQIVDPVTRVAELRSGGIHLAVELTPPVASGLESSPAVRVVGTSAPEYNFIAWNSKRPFFQDPQVRRALTMAIDRGAMVRSLRSGHGSVATGPLGPWHWAYDTSWRPLPVNADSAAVLLDAAGWRDSDGDGIRDRNGQPFRFDLMIAPNPEREDIALIVQAGLAAVGIDAQIAIREVAAMIPAVIGPERRYDAVLIGNVSDMIVDERDSWACDQVGQPNQFTSYCNPGLDPVMDSIPVVQDREVLRGLLRRFHQTIAADQPYTFLFYLDRINGVRGVQGVEFGVRGDWLSVHEWWVHPNDRR
ncbi:MAG: ABC transporter substrate-binding protein [Gemmatimonadota bacterium]